MDAEYPNADQARPRVIESASGTTDPDNSKSGPAAYIIFAITVALLMLLVTGVSGCVSALTDLALRDGVSLPSQEGRGQAPSLDDLLDDELDLEELRPPERDEFGLNDPEIHDLNEKTYGSSLR